jgi:hypothetical protein
MSTRTHSTKAVTWQTLIDALKAEGVNAGLWHTGGGCMAIGITTSTDTWAYITGQNGPISATPDADDGEGYLGLYADAGEWATTLVGGDLYRPRTYGEIARAVAQVLNAWTDPTIAGMRKAIAEAALTVDSEEA